MVIVTGAEQLPFPGMIAEIKHVVHRPFAPDAGLNLIAYAEPLYKIPACRYFKHGIGSARVLGTGG